MILEKFMSKHQLQKHDNGWQCEVCRQQWKGKPRRECPGVVVYGVKTFVGVPVHLKTEQQLAAQNLKPIGKPLGCVLERDQPTWLYEQVETEQLYPYPIIEGVGELKRVCDLQARNLSAEGVEPRAMMWFSGTWVFLYQLEDCSIADPNLPPIYPWGDRPENLKTAKQLARFNLAPGSAKPRGCSWGSWENRWIWLYDPNDEGFQILDSSLPRCFRYENEVPPEFKSLGQLPLFNLKLKDPAVVPKACYRIWSQYTKHEGEWREVYLYHRDDCEIDDPALPLCYEKDNYPTELKTDKELKDLNLASASGATPRGCYREYWHTKIRTIWLYHPDDCQWQPKDQWIAKTTLQRTYLLSDGWIRRLGSPDRIAENPHHEKWSEMKLYSRQRVEAFLAENAEEYAQWLSERDRYVAIFEQNREVIAAGRARANQHRREARQAELEQRRAEREAERELWRERSRQLEQHRLVQREADQPRREQMARCLKCASGCATSQGFLCVVHPTGLDLDQIPCIDWHPRS